MACEVRTRGLPLAAAVHPSQKQYKTRHTHRTSQGGKVIIQLCIKRGRIFLFREALPSPFFILQYLDDKIVHKSSLAVEHARWLCSNRPQRDITPRKTTSTVSHPGLSFFVSIHPAKNRAGHVKPSPLFIFFSSFASTCMPTSSSYQTKNATAPFLSPSSIITTARKTPPIQKGLASIDATRRAKLALGRDIIFSHHHHQLPHRHQRDWLAPFLVF